MPEKEGLETIVEMRRLRPDARIIAMSGGYRGLGMRVDICRAALRFGAKAMLQKPIETETLLGTIQEVLAGERLRAEYPRANALHPSDERVRSRSCSRAGTSGLRRARSRRCRRTPSSAIVPKRCCTSRESCPASPYRCSPRPRHENNSAPSGVPGSELFVRSRSRARSSADVVASRRWNCTTCHGVSTAPIAIPLPLRVDPDDVPHEEVTLVILPADLASRRPRTASSGRVLRSRASIPLNRSRRTASAGFDPARITLSSCRVTSIGCPIGRHSARRRCRR